MKLTTLALSLLPVLSLARPDKAPPPGKPLQQTGDSFESTARAQNNAEPLCHSAGDCNPICNKKLANDADAKKYGIMATCVGAPTPGAKDPKAMTGRCSCGNSKKVSEILIAIGETTCLAFNAGVNGGLDVATSVIPYVGPAAKGAKGLFKLGNSIVKEGAQNCAINFCPGHVYTAVDPNDINSQLGILAC